ncbi:MAG: glycoside hydrolase family 15 protein [Pseudomonadota bacterium]
MSSLDLGIIGNCSISALLDKQARIVWCCLPRFDGDPKFCSLLGGAEEPETGTYEIQLIDMERSEQSYHPNSAVLITRLYDKTGGAIEITDFAPRFKQLGRLFRPASLVRLVRPIAGRPRIRVHLEPCYDYGSQKATTSRGSNHIRYVMPDVTWRLTTDVPLTYIIDKTSFYLNKPVSLILGPDESLARSAEEVGREFLENTEHYWREWCRYLSVPFEWQDEVIRAAITLKLSNFEETGAIVAAMTTSIPEAEDTERNWDYRLCWLRDSFFVVHTLNGLGVTRTMEGYLDYITNIIADSEDGYLQPVFGIAREQHLIEKEITSLAGYRGMGPVRIGNGAYTQVQNDGYGCAVLACCQMFFDKRLVRRGDESLFRQLEGLGEQAVARWNTPDAGLWEFRGREEVHTHSSVMCWAACDRLARIAAHMGYQDRQAYWQEQAQIISDGIQEQAWNERLNSFVASFGGDAADASLLLLPHLGFIKPNDPRFLGTLEFIENELLQGPFLYRYVVPDDFGMPETSFNICTFWYIDALAAVGRLDEARTLFERMLASRNHLGLLSEDLHPDSGELWGNFPQTYSMVGIIQSAIRLSKPWEEAV